MHAPYLSVVVTSRNDNHGGTLHRRMQIFIDCLIAQCKRHEVAAELIIVEWNPPVDRPKLAEAMRWPADLGPCVVRIIEVPPELHARYKFARQLPLYQMIAKNVGIRRAKGEFILATNIDVIFNDELMAFIKERKLERGHMYRIDRTDVDALVPEGASMDETLAYCRSHVLRVNAREGTFPLRADGLRALAKVDVASEASGIALGMGWFEAESELLPGSDKPQATRWVDNDAEIWIAGQGGAEESQQKYIRIELEPGPSVGGRPFMFRATDAAGTVLLRQAIFGRRTITIPVTIRAGKLDKIILHAESRKLSAGTHHDPRTLNFRVYTVEVCDHAPVVQQRPDITTPGLGLGAGWYEPEVGDDGLQRWASNDSEIWIETPPARESHPMLLSIDIQPGPGIDNQPFELQVIHGDDEVIARRLVLRRTMVHIPLEALDLPPDSLHCLRLTLDSPNLPFPGDARVLNFRSRRVTIGESPAPSMTRPDVIEPAAPLGLGKGFHDLESTQAGLTRWIDSDATIWIDPGEDVVQVPRYLVIDLAPGPSAGAEPFVLEARGAVKHQHRSYAVWDRRTICIPLVLTLGAINEVTLHMNTPRLAVPGDPRILNAMVFSIRTADRPPSAPMGVDPMGADPGQGVDVADPSRFHFGSGWFSPEQPGGQWRRWADNDAMLWIAPPIEPDEQVLELDLEPGPSLAGRPLSIRITDETGRSVASADLSQRQTIAISLAPSGAPAARLTLSCDTPRKALEGDPRILNFALHRARMVPAKGVQQ